MTEFEIAQVKKQWEAGVRIKDIVQTLPYSKKSAEYQIYKLRVEGVLQERKRKSGKELVVQAYKSGITNPYEIAEQYGYSHKTVQIYLTEAKLGRDRPKRNWKKIDHSEKTELIIECLENGGRVNETARQFGVTKQRVSQIKKRLEEGFYD